MLEGELKGVLEGELVEGELEGELVEDLEGRTSVNNMHKIWYVSFEPIKAGVKIPFI